VEASWPRLALLKLLWRPCAPAAPARGTLLCCGATVGVVALTCADSTSAIDSHHVASDRLRRREILLATWAVKPLERSGSRT